MNESTIIEIWFNTPLSIIDRPWKPKSTKDKKDLNKTNNQLDLM